MTYTQNEPKSDKIKNVKVLEVVKQELQLGQSSDEVENASYSAGCSNIKLWCS